MKEVWSTALQSSAYPVLTPGRYDFFIQKQYIFDQYIYIVQVNDVSKCFSGNEPSGENIVYRVVMVLLGYYREYVENKRNEQWK